MTIHICVGSLWAGIYYIANFYSYRAVQQIILCMTLDSAHVNVTPGSGLWSLITVHCSVYAGLQIDGFCGHRSAE